MNQLFRANIPALSQEELELLEKSHVLLAGCGALGSAVLELLVRAGAGRITVIDPESVETDDRAFSLLADEANIGKDRVLCAKDRALAINPELVFDFWCSKLRASTMDSALSGKDLVIDATGTETDRQLLETACAEHGVTLLHVFARGWNAGILSETPGDGSISEFYRNNKLINTGSTPAPSVFLAASMAAAEAVRLLCGRDAKAKDCVRYYDLQEMNARCISPAENCLSERNIDITVIRFMVTQEVCVPESATISQIVKALDLESERYFVMRNKQFVMPEEYDKVIIEQGDILDFRKASGLNT